MPILQHSRTQTARMWPLPPLQLKKKVKTVQTKCSEDQSKQKPNEQVRKSCKVGHKVGRTLISPKVSPIAASPKWFINSLECITASKATRVGSCFFMVNSHALLYTQTISDSGILSINALLRTCSARPSVTTSVI